MDLPADSHPGTDFREGFSVAVHASTSSRACSRVIFVGGDAVERPARANTMRKYVCILIVVTGALFTPHGEGWKITDNALNVTINISSK